MNSNTIEIEAAESDVVATSYVLHKACKRVIKKRAALDEVTNGRATTASERIDKRKAISDAREALDTAESDELQAEEDWEAAIAALELVEDSND